MKSKGTGQKLRLAMSASAPLHFLRNLSICSSPETCLRTGNDVTVPMNTTRADANRRHASARSLAALVVGMAVAAMTLRAKIPRRGIWLSYGYRDGEKGVLRERSEKHAEPIRFSEVDASA